MFMLSTYNIDGAEWKNCRDCLVNNEMFDPDI